jgi:trehalose 6-phosphate phosphatase
MSDEWRDNIRLDETAVFLDIDGTLLGFEPRPDDVVADEPLRDLLRQLQEKAGGALALVSGRTIADIDRIVSPMVLPAAGTHGAELRFADGRREQVDSTILEDVRAAAEPFVAERPGLMLENKGASIALHYRNAPEREADIADFLRRVVTRDDLMVQHGKMVAEVKSRSCDKGRAIERLLATPPFLGRRPLFIGDDLTDEHGFEVANRRGGSSVKVGEGDTAAQYRVAAWQDVRGLLNHFIVTSLNDN